MSVWEYRQMIEQATPLWVAIGIPLTLLLVVIIAHWRKWL